MTLHGEVAHGDLAHGDFDLDYSNSIADALEEILEKPWLDRTWWLRAKPRDASTSTDPPTLLDVDLSTDGHRTYPDDAEELQLPEAIVSPYSVGISLEGLWGTASMDFGLVVIGNPRGTFTHLADEDWVGRQADVYVGPRGGTQVQFGRVGRLLSRQIQWDRDTLSLQVDDYGFLFDRPIQETSYLGRESVTGTDLTFTASTDKITSPGGGTDLSVFADYDYIKVLGSAGNSGLLKISSAATGEIQVDATVTGLVDEAAGPSVTIEGALQGGDDLKGRPIPILLGIERQFEPVLVDGPNHIYQMSAGAMEAVLSASDGRSALTFDADVADITLASPAPGEYATCLATGHLRLGENPEKVPTVAAKGHNGSAYGYVETFAGLAKLLAVTFAGLSDPGELDGVALASLANHTAVMGHWTGLESQSIRSVMQRFCQDAGAWLWLRPDKVMTGGRVTDPDLATADFELNAQKDDLRMEPWDVQPFEIPVGRVRVGYRRYSRVLSNTEVLGSVSQDDRKDAGEEYRFAKAEDADVFVQIPDADEIEILTNLDTEADAQAFADEQLALRKKPRRLGTFAPRKGLIKRGLGNVFSLTDNRLPTSPKKWVILGLRNEAAQSGEADEITWTCFG